MKGTPVTLVWKFDVVEHYEIRGPRFKDFDRLKRTTFQCAVRIRSKPFLRTH